jgi:hypothetical protein
MEIRKHATNEEALVACHQVREQLISSGIKHANRLRELRTANLNYDIAVMKGGGMGLIFIKGGSSLHGQYKFGPLWSSNIHRCGPDLVRRWNGHAGENHEVGLVKIQEALAQECVKILTLMADLEKSRERLESRQ